MSTSTTEYSPICFEKLRQRWNWFFYESPDARICALVRIGYAALLLFMLMIQWRDIEFWFSESGILPFELSRQVIDPDTSTVFQWFNDTPDNVRVFYGTFVLQTVLLLVGFGARFQAICILFWLTSFHHRNCLLLDGEDTVFRLFAFLLALSPSSAHYSIDSWIKSGRKDNRPKVGSAWALRLMQLQMTMIYLSTAWEKLNGDAWLDGTALYYASRLDDLFGRGPVPSFLFDNLTCLKLMTWCALAIEVMLPICLWFKQTRRYAIVAGIGLHLSIEWMMNLFLFEWIMLVGLCSFLMPADLKMATDCIRSRLQALNLPRVKQTKQLLDESEVRPQQVQSHD